MSMRSNFKVTNTFFRTSWSTNNARDQEETQTHRQKHCANAHLKSTYPIGLTTCNCVSLQSLNLLT